MTHGYHQIILAEESQAISTFQTHEGLHRFKVLLFGASPATNLLHDRVKAVLDGLPGCTSIHDNILVWGSTRENLDKCLTRLQDKELTLRRETECTFGATSVSWFGKVISKSGKSPDLRKIMTIQELQVLSKTMMDKLNIDICSPSTQTNTVIVVHSSFGSLFKDMVGKSRMYFCSVMFRFRFMSN